MEALAHLWRSWNRILLLIAIHEVIISPTSCFLCHLLTRHGQLHKPVGILNVSHEASIERLTLVFLGAALSEKLLYALLLSIFLNQLLVFAGCRGLPSDRLHAD